MKYYGVVFFLLCLLSTAVLSNQMDLRTSVEIDTAYSDTLFHTGNYIIGSGDSLFLHDTYFHLDGDLFISGNGILDLNRSCISIAGDVTVSGNGMMRDTLSLIRFRSDYLYQRGFYMRGSATYFGHNSIWHFEDWIANMAVIDNARYEGFGIDYIGGPTATLLGKGFIGLNECRYFVEFVIIQDSVSLELSNCDTILIWLGIPDGTTGTLSPPGGMNYKFCNHYEITPFSGTLNDVEYSVIVDSSSIWWGTIPSSGCSVTIESCTLRTTGLYMDEPRIYNLTGVYDSTYYDFFELGLPDRYLALDDVYMITWNFYGQFNARINIDSCVFGECLAMGNSEINITNSICDGTGGWIGATSNATISLNNVTVQTIAQTQENGRMNLKDSYVLWNIQSTGSSTITAVDVDYSPYTEIAAHDSSRLVWAKITSPPDSSVIHEGDTIYVELFSIFGPRADPESLTALLTYMPPDSFFWRAMGDTAGSIPDGPLTPWNVACRPVGTYDVRLNVRLEPDIELVVNRVFDYVGTSIEEQIIPEQLYLSISPNPFNSACLITLSEAASQIEIFDIGGNLVRKIPLFGDSKSVIWYGKSDSGQELPSGIYFVRPSGNAQHTEKVVIVR